MADAALVRTLSMALPQAQDQSDGERLAFAVGGKGFCWTYLHRADPKKPRKADPGVLAIRCEPARKALLIEAAPEVFFDDDHYRGFPAVLVRLPAVDEAELAALLKAAWRLRAPKALLKAAG